MILCVFFCNKGYIAEEVQGRGWGWSPVPSRLAVFDFEGKAIKAISLTPKDIEAITYRLSDHTTADDSSRYRKKDEVENAWKVEPLIRIRRYLNDLGVWDDDKEQALLDASAAKVDVAVQLYLNTPKPAVESMFDHMYSDLPEFLEEQRDHAMQYGDTNGDAHG